MIVGLGKYVSLYCVDINCIINYGPSLYTGRHKYFCHFVIRIVFQLLAQNDCITVTIRVNPDAAEK